MQTDVDGAYTYAMRELMANGWMDTAAMAFILAIRKPLQDEIDRLNRELIAAGRDALAYDEEIERLNDEVTKAYRLMRKRSGRETE